LHKDEGAVVQRAGPLRGSVLVLQGHRSGGVCGRRVRKPRVVRACLGPWPLQASETFVILSEQVRARQSGAQNERNETLSELQLRGPCAGKRPRWPAEHRERGFGASGFNEYPADARWRCHDLNGVDISPGKYFRRRVRDPVGFGARSSG
jgi:hypothetical protein